jgi:hypothetical protein
MVTLTSLQIFWKTYNQALVRPIPQLLLVHGTIAESRVAALGAPGLLALARFGNDRTQVSPVSQSAGSRMHADRSLPGGLCHRRPPRHAPGDGRVLEQQT